jgi:hypothetical protein
VKWKAGIPIRHDLASFDDPVVESAGLVVKRGQRLLLRQMKSERFREIQLHICADFCEQRSSRAELCVFAQNAFCRGPLVILFFDDRQSDVPKIREMVEPARCDQRNEPHSRPMQAYDRPLKDRLAENFHVG